MQKDEFLLWSPQCERCLGPPVKLCILMMLHQSARRRAPSSLGVFAEGRVYILVFTHACRCFKVSIAGASGYSCVCTLTVHFAREDKVSSLWSPSASAVSMPSKVCIFTFQVERKCVSSFRASSPGTAARGLPNGFSCIFFDASFCGTKMSFFLSSPHSGTALAASGVCILMLQSVLGLVFTS